MRFNYVAMLVFGLLASGVVMASSYNSSSGCCGSSAILVGLLGGVTLVALNKMGKK